MKGGNGSEQWLASSPAMTVRRGDDSAARIASLISRMLLMRPGGLRLLLPAPAAGCSVDGRRPGTRAAASETLVVGPPVPPRPDGASSGALVASPVALLMRPDAASFSVKSCTVLKCCFMSVPSTTWGQEAGRGAICGLACKTLA